MRYVVLTYLVLQTAAGPAFCCCSVGRALDAVVSACQPNRQEPACCCCCPSTPAEPSESENRGAPSDRPDCPCQEHSLTVVWAAQPRDQAGDETQRLFATASAESQYAEPSTLTGPTASSLEYPGASALPFLDADALLHVHHLLRC